MMENLFTLLFIPLLPHTINGVAIAVWLVIIDTITDYSRLYHDLKRMDRDNFSYDGARALMEWLNGLSEDTGENIEYDPIAFCCDFSEHETIGMLCDDYSNAPQADDYDDPDEWEEAALDYFRDNTVLIEFDNGIIIQGF